MFSMVQCFKRGVWVSIEEVSAILMDLYPDSWEEEYALLVEEGYILENGFLSTEDCLVGYKPFYIDSEETDCFVLSEWIERLEKPANSTYPEKYDDFFAEIFYDLGEKVENYYVQYFI